MGAVERKAYTGNTGIYHTKHADVSSNTLLADVQMKIYCWMGNSVAKKGYHPRMSDRAHSGSIQGTGGRN